MGLRRFAVLGLCTIGVCAIGACGPSREPFALRAVVATEIQKLASEEPTTIAVTPPDLEARTRKLLGRFALGYAELEDLQEATALGDASTAFLVRELHARNSSVEHRSAVLTLLGARHTPTAADVITRELAQESEPKLRADAALALAFAGQEQVVPALLEQRFVETDASVANDIDFALCLLGNYSGAARLAVVEARDPRGPARLEGALAHAKQTNPSAQWDNLQGSAAKILDQLWSNGDPQRLITTNQPTPRQRLEVWKRIARLSTSANAEPDSNSKTDEALDPREREARRDARRRAAEYALENGAPWTADLLALALHDEDRGVRAGAARALGRMGWRAQSAFTALVAALDEPTIASDAARALGEIGEPKAIDALLVALASDATAVRAAAAEALGNLGATNAIEPLRAAIDAKEPIGLRIAAVCALSRLGQGDEVESAMIALLENAAGDLTAIENELEARLVAASAAERAGAREALNAWRALAPPPHVELDARDVAERFRGRARVMRSLAPAKAR